MVAGVGGDIRLCSHGVMPGCVMGRMIARLALNGVNACRLARPVMHGAAGHAHCRSHRIEREHGHEEPEQQCLERSIHYLEVYQEYPGFDLG